MRYVMYFRFVDDVIFHTIKRMGRIREDAYVWLRSPGGGTGGEVCRLHVTEQQVSAAADIPARRGASRPACSIQMSTFTVINW